MIPKVQCPVRLALGHGGQMHFLLLAAEAQVHRFVDAQLERYVIHGVRDTTPLTNSILA